MINTLMPGYKSAAGSALFALRDIGNQASAGHSGKAYVAPGSTPIVFKLLRGGGETNERQGRID
jgi:hypothetical protein